MTNHAKQAELSKESDGFTHIGEIVPNVMDAIYQKVQTQGRENENDPRFQNGGDLAVCEMERML